MTALEQEPLSDFRSVPDPRCILAIDPGSQYSAWLVYQPATTGVRAFGKVPNEELLASLRAGDWVDWPDVDVLVIEWMSPRGLPTSAQEFETMWWAGRFSEAAHPTRVERLKRDDVKFYLCGRRNKVNDSNVRAALIDRFGGIGGKEAAVGRKATPGPLYGIADDVWAALAVAVVFADQEAAR
jgi:hypothetical protein